jgi:hypothetical protein
VTPATSAPYTIFIGSNACLILPPKLCLDHILACSINFLSSLFLPQSRSLLPHATDPISVQTHAPLTFLSNVLIHLPRAFSIDSQGNGLLLHVLPTIRAPFLYQLFITLLATYLDSTFEVLPIKCLWQFSSI